MSILKKLLDTMNKKRRRCDHSNAMGKKKRRRVKKGGESHLETLPTELLIHVLEFCGAREIVFLSRVSELMQERLMKRGTVSQMIQIRDSNIVARRSSIKTPSSPEKPVRFQTLEQLALYESIKKHNLHVANHFPPDSWFEGDEGQKHSIEETLTSAIQEILKENPSAILIMNLHKPPSWRPPYTQWWRQWHLSWNNFILNLKNKYSQSELKEWSAYDLRNFDDGRIDATNPFTTKVLERGWVDFSFCLPSGQDRLFFLYRYNTRNGKKTFELPPQPDAYQLIVEYYHRLYRYG